MKLEAIYLDTCHPSFFQGVSPDEGYVLAIPIDSLTRVSDAVDDLMCQVENEADLPEAWSNEAIEAALKECSRFSGMDEDEELIPFNDGGLEFPTDLTEVAWFHTANQVWQTLAKQGFYWGSREENGQLGDIQGPYQNEGQMIRSILNEYGRQPDEMCHLYVLIREEATQTIARCEAEGMIREEIEYHIGCKDIIADQIFRAGMVGAENMTVTGINRTLDWLKLNYRIKE